jgi:hypothetical protein
MLVISPRFSRIGLAKAYNADAIRSFRKHQRVKPAFDHTKRAVTRFSIVLPVVDPDQRGFKIEIRSFFKAKATLYEIALTFEPDRTPVPSFMYAR